MTIPNRPPANKTCARPANPSRYGLLVAMVVAATVTATPGMAAPYRVVAESSFTRIHIDGFDYSLEGKLFRPESEGRFPLVVLAHGACGKGCRSRYKESRLSSPARVFARSGYVAYTFNRIGYGKSDGHRLKPHRAYAGIEGCRKQNFIRAARRTGLQARLVIQAMTRHEFVDPERILAVGQSGGGMAVLALTEGPEPHAPLSGLKGVISVAGALGGSCAKGDYMGSRFMNENMVETYRSFGRASRTPVLMIYARNDPRQLRTGSWLAAYNRGGSKAKLVMIPDQGDTPRKGHQFFYRRSSTKAWKPHFNAFLASLGLPKLQ